MKEKKDRMRARVKTLPFPIRPVIGECGMGALKRQSFWALRVRKKGYREGEDRRG